ncbi:M12 family metallopeptidase [Bacillus wiedmannii]|uniref:M12 family metallopeptidase n=1 Tax=Bacillus wiedmannii TaxID=1890302 RepID=UPI000BF4C8FE|nr:M12 family metallopeptidase [Bacillus wiedmannii]PEU23779.1 Tolloid-like protein 1 [Bacillus wiedmannii]
MSHSLKICIDKTLYDEKISTSENGPLALIGLNTKSWKKGNTLRIKFLDGSTEIQEKVKKYALEWTKYANIKFNFVQSGSTEIRITFKESGSWSYIGTDCLTIPQDMPTMNYGFFNLNTPESQLSSVVLHQFGHALGLGDEHHHPENTIPWDKDAVYRYYQKSLGWNSEMIDFHIFQKYERGISKFSEYDKDSIMQYPVPNELTIGDYEIGWNEHLSELDKKFIKELYPFN